MYGEFIKQLHRREEGLYENLWVVVEAGSWSSRLERLVRKLQRDPDIIDKYDEIIQDQLEEGIVERVVEEPNERVSYIPHKPLKRETATTTGTH